ncbi:MAG TPA: DUF2169 domain-containing protein [Polyangia bacterium]|nr:DUF2169 domain-containing protein [Polyangia bacterium]
MELANQTPFPARLLRFQRAEDALVDGGLILKATFQKDEAGRWIPTAEQLPLVGEPLSTAFGVFHSENFLRKDGVDLCVLGTVRAPRPRRGAEVCVSVGARRSTLMVYGERRWLRSGRGGLVASGPEPFEEMPISYHRAYGGKTVYDYEEISWPDNPVGRGYYLSEEAAEGQPLANIEKADAPPVRSWSDQPPVSGWGPYPCFWGLRAREAVKPDRANPSDLPTISRRLNNNAHPDLVLAALPESAEIRLTGLGAAEMVYTVPPLRTQLEVTVGDAVVAQPPIQVDGVFLWTDLGHVTVTARAHFNYSYARGEVRRARLSVEV